MRSGVKRRGEGMKFREAVKGEKRRRFAVLVYVRATLSWRVLLRKMSVLAGGAPVGLIVFSGAINFPVCPLVCCFVSLCLFQGTCSAEAAGTVRASRSR